MAGRRPTAAWAARLGWGGSLGVALVCAGAAGAPATEKVYPNADFLFTNPAVPRLRIEIPPEGLAVLRSYQWKWGGNPEERTKVLVTVREGGRAYTNVTLHLKGGAGSFRPVDENPCLTLNFSKAAPGQSFYGLQKLHLNNSVQDPSFLCEALARELFLAAGVPAPRATHAVVELNGRPLGLYVLVEGANKQFLSRFFTNVSGNLWDGGFVKDIDKPLEVNCGDEPTNRLRLDALVALCQQSDSAERLQRLRQVLDLDRFLDFIALEILVCHWDGYAMARNNYRVFHDLGTDRIVFIPQGLDQLFGTWKSTPESPITPMMKSLVARAVTQAPEGRRLYLEHLARLLTKVFREEALLRRLDELAANVQPCLDGQQRLEHQRAVAALKERISRRVRSAQAQLATASTPLAFDAAGVAALTGWRPNRDSGSPGFGRTRRDGQVEALIILAPNRPACGSWRTTVTLAAGHYRFTGRVKTEQLETDGVSRGGVALRVSGEREAPMLGSAPDWTTLSYEFSLPGLRDVEVVCELRARNGQALFDAASLKLLRAAPAAAPR